MRKIQHLYLTTNKTIHIHFLRLYDVSSETAVPRIDAYISSHVLVFDLYKTEIKHQITVLVPPFPFHLSCIQVQHLALRRRNVG